LFKEIIIFIFRAGCLINSTAFWIQAHKISKNISSKNVSIFMLSLFTIFQTSGDVYGRLNSNPKAMWGFIVLLLYCLNTNKISIKYRNK
jgi:hypothetical protein